MKFFAGFMTGVVVTLLGVLFWLKKEVPPTSEAEVTQVSQASISPEDMPEGFADFFKKFHRDSLYQMAHIVFPLEGMPANADSTDVANNAFRWQPEGWVMHKPFNDMDDQFERKFVPLGNDLVIEQIKGVQGQYGMQRRFAREAEGWQLIYYAGMNKLLVAEQAVE